MRFLNLIFFPVFTARCFALAAVWCGAIAGQCVCAQTVHDASYALRSGWEGNPARFQTSTGAPMVYCDGSYAGSLAVNQQTLRWRADASQRKAIGFDMDTNEVSAEMEMIRSLNPWMKAWLKGRLDQVSDFERHWRKDGHWANLERATRAGEVGFLWDMDRKSGELRITKRSVKYAEFGGYDRNEFCMEASFRRNVFRRVRGAYKLPLVNPKRIEPAGTIWSKLKYDQLGFGTWFQGNGIGEFDAKTSRLVSSLPANGVDLNSPRLWMVFSGQVGYTAPELQGWSWGANASMQRLQDEGERRFDRIDRGGRMWVKMKHSNWHWYAKGALSHQLMGSAQIQSWWQWELGTQIGYAISSSARAVCTFQWLGMANEEMALEQSFLGDWQGSSFSIGLQWRQTSRSKWTPSNEDFNGLCMK